MFQVNMLRYIISTDFSQPDNSPAWLKQAAEALRSKFPHDLFETENGQARCLDCDGLFELANNGSLSGLQAHLNGRSSQGRKRKASRERFVDRIASASLHLGPSIKGS
jgi:hypothetical protein